MKQFRNVRDIGFRTAKMALVLFFVLVISGVSVYANGNKDLILVLDTSLSMAGKGGGGKNIFPSVKESLKHFVEKLETGDSLTIMTFDSEVKTYPTIRINDKNDKDIINNYIGMIEAKGLWTHTMGMLKEVFARAHDLETKAQGRQQVIVILSDGLDDPPPSMKAERFNLKDVASGYSDREWFIYLVDFGQLKQNKKIAQDLQSVASTKVISGEGGPAVAIEQNLQADVDRVARERALANRPFFLKPWFIALVVIAIILIVLLLLYRQSQIKAFGSLDYYNNTLLNPYLENYDMARQHLREILIGRAGANLVLRDFDPVVPVKIRAERVKGRMVMKLIVPEGVSAEFQNRESDGYLLAGDIFKVANYTFTFKAIAQ
jgi:hypothetical protein